MECRSKANNCCEDQEIGLTSGVIKGVDSRLPCALWTLAACLASVGALCLGFVLGTNVLWVDPDDGPILLGLGSRKAAVNFLVVGDWGREGKYNQSRVAHQMGRIAESLDADFIVSSGDNFYERGLKGIHDKKFDRSFTDVYTHHGLQKQWYSVLGNHDYMGDALAQLDPSLRKKDPRWFCDRAFEVEKSLCHDAEEKCSDTIELFFFDTNTFVTRYRDNPDGESFDWRNMLRPWESQLEAQLKDLQHALKKSRATWKIVIGHHGIRSNGRHGDTPELIDNLVPLLEAYGVSLYVNGHDHDLEHVKRSDSSVHYITSGAGSKAYRGFRDVTPEDGQVFGHVGQGFISVSASRTWLNVGFYDVHGSTIHYFDLWK